MQLILFKLNRRFIINFFKIPHVFQICRKTWISFLYILRINYKIYERLFNQYFNRKITMDAYIFYNAKMVCVCLLKNLELKESQTFKCINIWIFEMSCILLLKYGIDIFNMILWTRSTILQLDSDIYKNIFVDLKWINKCNCGKSFLNCPSTILIKISNVRNHKDDYR